MKLTITQKTLATNLSLVGRAVPSRPSHPILANVLLIASEENQQVSLSAFDLSLGIQSSFPASIEEGGSITLPAKLLDAIVSRLPDGDIILSTEGTTVDLISSSGRYQVRGIEPDEFPELPAVEDGETITLSANLLMDGIRSSLFAASGDESKQILTGVHLKIGGGSLEFAATDGHRLAVINQHVDSDRELDVTIPAKALQDLTKVLFLKSDSTVSVSFDNYQVLFESEGRRLTTRLLEGSYPNYPQLLPKQFAHQLTVERRVFLSALERIGVIADQSNGIIKLNICSGGEVAISIDAADVGSGREIVPAQVSGDDLEIAFNAKYLMEGLKNSAVMEVQLNFNTPTSPAVLVPLGVLKMQYLVMPVQTRGI